jgi:hypothetical protein
MMNHQHFKLGQHELKLTKAKKSMAGELKPLANLNQINKMTNYTEPLDQKL